MRALSTTGKGGLLSLLLGALPVAVAILSASPAPVSAQDLLSQPVPFTAYLDFKVLAAKKNNNAAFPIWLESVEFDAPVAEGAEAPEKTTFRLRFRKVAGINDNLLIRLFFDDLKGKSPAISAWTELGDLIAGPKTVGSGLGLPDSETATVPMKGVDYIDIVVPGDGSNVKGAFLSSLGRTQIWKSIDFDLPTTLADPFQGSTAASPGKNDSYLFGRVKATLDNSAPALLSSTDGTSCAFSFNLANQPMVAVVTFEIMNADISSPPLVTVNSHPVGAANLLLPDLADPAFQGTARPLISDMQFHYAGWLKCQKVLPGSSLQGGDNQLVIELGDPTGSVAIRAIEVQLKYNWDNFDYKLAP